jgi:hypothetical protein
VGLVDVTALVVALASLVVRWHRSTDVVLQQLRWIAFGAAAGVLLFGLGFVVGPVATALGLVPLPAACLVAVLRHGLWDLDVVLSRSLVYVTLTAVVIAAYAAVVALLGAAVGGTTGAPIVATALVAVGVLPLHQRLQALVNRLVHGDRDEPFAVLSRLGARLEGRPGRHHGERAGAADVVAAVARSLHVPYAAVVLCGRQRRGVRAAGRCRRAAATALRRSGGGPAGRGPAGGRADQGALIRAAAGAASPARPASTVRRSRSARDVPPLARGRTVAARERSAVALYRDLHDGRDHPLGRRSALLVEPPAPRAQPARARRRPAGERAGSSARAPSTRCGWRARLRPPALDDLGLAEALRELGGGSAATPCRSTWT